MSRLLFLLIFLHLCMINCTKDGYGRPQNHGMAKFGMDHLNPTPAQEVSVLEAFNIFKEGDSKTSLWQCFVSHIVWKCFLPFSKKLFYFNLFPLPLLLALGTTERILAPSFLHSPFRYLCTFLRFPWASSSPGCTVPTCSAFLHRRDSPVTLSSLWSYILLSPVWQDLSCTEGTRHSTPCIASPMMT